MQAKIHEGTVLTEKECSVYKQKLKQYTIIIDNRMYLKIIQGYKKVLSIQRPHNYFKPNVIVNIFF